MIPHYKNLSLENIIDSIDGITYIEEWRDIPDYGGRYQVSSFGRVKSITMVGRKREKNRRLKEKILKPSLRQRYPFVGLYKNMECKSIPCHRLVGFAFIPNPENKPEINHKRGVHHHNHFTQIEWMTGKENKNHALDTGLRKMPKGKNHWAFGTKGDPRVLKRIMYGKDNHKSIWVLDTQTGIFYESIRQACIAKGLKYKNTAKHLDGTFKENKTSLIYA